MLIYIILLKFRRASSKEPLPTGQKTTKIKERADLLQV